MATWTKSGKDIRVLLSEAAEIEPEIGEALGDVAIENADDLTRIVASSCWGEVFQDLEKSINQGVEIELDYAKWNRSGKLIIHEGRVLYGAREPGFTLSWSQRLEEVSQDPREWTPRQPAMVVTLTLTLARVKSGRELKNLAKDLGWELVSG